VKIETLSQRLNDLAVRPRFETALLAFFACAGLLLAIIGLYGVTAYLVTQWTREIGVRIAVGATPPDILRLILAEALRLITFGCTAGLAPAFSLSRVLRSLLFNVSPHDPATFAAVTMVLGCAAMLAAVIPARSAMRVDPVVALHSK
jgi:ABC-type antimicrobial peptide transport system permease subunit